MADATAVPTKMAQSKRVFTKNLTAHIVADLLITFCNRHGDLLTNLRLQRLLYYAQAWHLALYNEDLFRDDFQAWVHGPVQPDVYVRFQPHGTGLIDCEPPPWVVAKRIEQHIEHVMEVYGRFSAYDLERIACDEEPWREARRGLAIDDPATRSIDKGTMKRFYESKLEQEKA